MQVIINPGAGPVKAGAPMDALASVVELFREAAVQIARITYRGVASDGRHRFAVTAKRGRKVEIDMPAWHAEELRTGTLNTPRIYVDGNSWLWRFAVRAVQE